MKLLIAVFAVATLLCAADPQASKAPKVIQPMQIPAGAVESEPGTFRFADAQGKKWIYRQTPFGIAGMEDVPSGQALPSDKAGADVEGSDVKATQDGGTIHFERPGPFGVYRWQKSQSELNAMEQAVWDRQRAQASPKQASVKQD